MTKEKTRMVEKVRKLLALAGNNPSDEEAQAAMLKAQELMAEHDISEESLNDVKEYRYVELPAKHPNNEGFRTSLSVIIGKNFRCKPIMHGTQVYFYGREEDCEVCVEVFNYAYKFAKNRGIGLRNKYRNEGRYHKGVANSYYIGFMSGLKSQFEVQATALMIVTPPDVTENFALAYPVTKNYKHGMKRGYVDGNAYHKGMDDGKNFMNRKQIGGK